MSNLERNRISIFVLLVTVLVIAAATLSPEPDHLHPAADVSGRLRYFLLDLGIGTSIDSERFEFIANIIMFVPLGIVLGIVLRGAYRWLGALILPLVSVGIETTQYLLLPNRGPELADVVANSIGGWIGLAVVPLAGAFAGAVASGRETSRTGPTSADHKSLLAAVLPAMDILGWGFAVFFSRVVMSGFEPATIHWRAVAMLIVFLAAAQLVVGWYLRVYRAPSRGRRVAQLSPSSQLQALTATIVGVGIIAWVMVLFAQQTVTVPRSLMFAATPVALMFSFSIRYLVQVSGNDS